MASLDASSPSYSGQFEGDRAGAGDDRGGEGEAINGQSLEGWGGQKGRAASVIINLIFVFSISLSLLGLIFVIQKQRIIQSAQPRG